MVKDQPQPQTFDRNSRNTSVMSRLKDSIISQLDSSSSPSLHIDDHSSFLHSRLQHFFQSFHTPTHPPYALMIRRAVTELNDGSGSTKEAISEFIRKEYEDLPWAHTKILDFHLKKLCQVDDLSFIDDGRYALLVNNGEGTQQKCKGRRKSGNGDGERMGMVESIEIREQFQKESSIDCDDDDDNELPQYYNQRNLEENLDENSIRRRLKQKIPKGPIGRPRKTNTVANSKEESSFNKQGFIANNTVKQGRGRPHKVNHDTEQWVDQSQLGDQAKQSGRRRSRGFGRGRGRNRGVNKDTEQCEDQSHSKDQGGEGVDQDIKQCEQSHSDDQAKPSGRGRRGSGGRGRGRRPSGNSYRESLAVKKYLLE